MESFTGTKTKKVTTLVKYSTVTFMDLSTPTKIRGVKDDEFSYPTLSKIKKYTHSTYYNYKVLSGFDSDKNKFEENDLTINTIRYNVNIPFDIEWSLSNQTIVIESDRIVEFEIVNSNGSIVPINYSKTLSEDGTKYIYNIVLQLTNVEAEDQIHCTIKVYEDSKKTINVINSSFIIYVLTSSSPGGD